MTTRLNFFASAPSAMKAMSALQLHIDSAGIERSLLELVRLRVSQVNGCAYCVDHHTADARSGGESERRLAAVACWRDTPFFTGRERAALEWAEDVTLVGQTRVPDATWDTATAHFTDAELVELTLAVTTVNAWNRFAIAFRKLPS